MALVVNFQLGDWTFCVTGVGLPPGPQEPINITATISDHSTAIIPFCNPTDVHVLLDVCLSGQFWPFTLDIIMREGNVTPLNRVQTHTDV